MNTYLASNPQPTFLHSYTLVLRHELLKTELAYFIFVQKPHLTEIILSKQLSIIFNY